MECEAGKALLKAATQVVDEVDLGDEAEVLGTRCPRGGRVVIDDDRDAVGAKIGIRSSTLAVGEMVSGGWS